MVVDEPDLPTLQHSTIVCFCAVNQSHTNGGILNCSLPADPLLVPGPPVFELSRSEVGGGMPNSNPWVNPPSVLLPTTDEDNNDNDDGSDSSSNIEPSLIFSVPALLPQPSSNGSVGGCSGMFMEEDDVLPPYWTPVKTLLTCPVKVGISTAVDFLALECCVIDPGICVCCIKYLESVEDHVCV